jgi:AraC-like DNA-binding protein
MLEAGRAPAETAVAVGFTDQPHLNRHFTRIVGVPPGAYQRERRNVQDLAGRAP